MLTIVQMVFCGSFLSGADDRIRDDRSIPWRHPSRGGMIRGSEKKQV